MKTTRRSFLSTAGIIPFMISKKTLASDSNTITIDDLDRAAAGPLLHLEGIREAVTIKSMELLRNGNEFLVRIRSTNGAEGVIAANSSRMRDTYPIFINRVAPFWIGKDAREIETLFGEMYRQGSNYKFQGLAFWICVAAAEMAILEMLGRISGLSIGQMFGGVKQGEIAVYRASGNRGNRPEEEIEYLQKLVEETGAKAIKFRLGGRMSNNRDSLPERTEALIPMVRDVFGDKMTLYADANSSYDATNAIRIGRMMEEYKYAFFEEPCPFDDLWETKKVTDTLTIPVAGGEQEFSLRRFRWSILNRVVDVVQPDLHYFGGLIRSTRVALMAAKAGLPCTPHMSGSGMGYVNSLHFCSYIPNAAPHMEYKGMSDIPFHCETSPLKCVNGIIKTPTGPGFGLEIDPDYIKESQVVTTI